MLEWAVLAPSADVVLALLPYSDSVAIQSTLRLSLDTEGAVWSRDGLRLRPFTHHKWYIMGLYDGDFFSGLFERCDLPTIVVFRALCLGSQGATGYRKLQLS